MALLTPVVGQGEEKTPAEQIQSYVYGTMDEPGREAAVEGLLAADPALATSSIDGTPLLIWALDMAGIEGDLGRKGKTLAGMALRHGADVNMRDGSGDPLVVKYGRFAQVEPLSFLIKHGADANAKDVSDGRTALHWVALLEEVDTDPADIPRRLAAAGALLDGKADINARDVRGDTPLHATAFLGNARMVEFLLARGANPAAKNNDGRTPADMARMRQESEWANEQEKSGLKPALALLESGERPPLGSEAASPSGDGQVPAEAAPTSGPPQTSAPVKQPAAATGAGRLSEVIIDHKNAAYTLFIGVPAGGLTADQAAQLTAAGDVIDRVAWADFVSDPGKYVNGRIIKNEYPEVQVAKGITELLQKMPKMPFAVTWNGGIAFTFNDYEHTRATYDAYQANPSGYTGRPANQAADPVHPMNHLKSLLGW